MKKLVAAIQSICIVAILTGCMTANLESTRVSVFASDAASCFLDFVRSDPVLKNDVALQCINAVDITENWDAQENGFYLAGVKTQFMWGTRLYMVAVDGNEITNIIDTGLSGSSEDFSYDVVAISQGVFIAAYCSSHSGNGDLELVCAKQPGTNRYTIPGAVDRYFDDDRQTAMSYGLEESENEITASAIYLGGKLHARYADADNDGNTDIILTGIRQVYLSGTTDACAPQTEYYVQMVYRFDPRDDTFSFDASRSKELPIR